MTAYLHMMASDNCGPLHPWSEPGANLQPCTTVGRCHSILLWPHRLLGGLYSNKQAAFEPTYDRQAGGGRGFVAYKEASPGFISSVKTRFPTLCGTWPCLGQVGSAYDLAREMFGHHILSQGEICLQTNLESFAYLTAIVTTCWWMRH